MQLSTDLTGPRDATTPRVRTFSTFPAHVLTQALFGCVLSTCCVNLKKMPALDVIQDMNLVQIMEKAKFEKLITSGKKGSRAK
jgi:hypothetical protein